MSDADAAFAKAEEMIEAAIRDGAFELILDREETRALDRLPERIAEAVSLRVLDLGSTQVTDLAPLSGLTALTSLSLDNTQVTDLAPLSGLTALTWLFLHHSQVTDLAPLSGLMALISLSLAGTQITDLAPLSGMTAMRRLYLDSTQVTDFAPLAGLTTLESLSLDKTQITDLAPLSGLTALTGLSIANIQVTDLAPLSGLTALTELFLNHTQIADLAPLAGLTALTSLSLDNTQVTDLAPLSGLMALTGLFLNHTQITDLAPLAGLTALEALSLDNTQVTDLAPISGLTGLRRLDLDRVPTPDLRPIAGLRRLVEEPIVDGLTFRESGAAEADPRIAEIAGIEDHAERARTLFAYLEEWEPRKASGSDVRDRVPEQWPAPIRAGFDGDTLVELPVTGALDGDAERRARQGWAELKDYLGDIRDTMQKDNLPNLSRALDAFGRALGARFEDMRPIGVGTHGERIVSISKSAEAVLLEDAAGDLTAFAGAISVLLQRFPDWVAYKTEIVPAAIEGPALIASRDDLHVISEAFGEAPFVDAPLAAKFADLLVLPEDADVSDALAKAGVLGSLSNMLAPVAERALRGARTAVSDVWNASYKLGVQAAAGSVTTTVSAASVDLLINQGRVLISLSREYPTYLGWVENVLKALGWV